tara:strand:- start:3882 stop:4100 length:219 start_codon:yes stop_codon:yes gene_type:complete
VVVIVTPAANLCALGFLQRFLVPAIPGGNPSGRREATSKIAPGDFLWPAIPGGDPSGRRGATSKIAPGDFLF